jgi:hypothetical protein
VNEGCFRGLLAQARALLILGLLAQLRALLHVLKVCLLQYVHYCCCAVLLFVRDVCLRLLPWLPQLLCWLHNKLL